MYAIKTITVWCSMIPVLQLHASRELHILNNKEKKHYVISNYQLTTLSQVDGSSNCLPSRAIRKVPYRNIWVTL